MQMDLSMRFGLAMLLCPALTGTVAAQMAPELAAYVAIGKRYADPRSAFTGGMLAIGLSSPASKPGPGVGIRAAATAFGERAEFACPDSGRCDQYGPTKFRT